MRKIRADREKRDKEIFRVDDDEDSGLSRKVPRQNAIPTNATK